MTSQGKGRGVLPINPAATRKPQKSQQRAPAARLRLIVRRLPPGLTETEFWETVGTDWAVGKGKVDWAAFKPGKISKDLAKPSKPARAYLKVKDSTLLEPLSAVIKQGNFHDAKGTSRDSCLFGPPSLEFAPYNRVPGGRPRNDGRQGTIDQDPEFIDFLQSLTEPITKPVANGTEADGKVDKVTTTPLVQFIKDKKANKAKEKETTSTKASKKNQDGKDSKSTPLGTNEPKTKNAAVKGATGNTDKTRNAKSTHDTVQANNKSVTSVQQSKSSISNTSEAKSLQKEPSQPAAPTQPNQPPQSTPKRERLRGDANAAARIVARDLGLVPKEGRTPRGPRAQASAGTVTATAASTVTTPTTSTTTQLPASSPESTNANAPSVGPQPPTGPRAHRSSRQNTPASAPTTPNVSNPRPPKQGPQPSQHAKSAFLKHANPSQGVTEELLNDAFSGFGVITRCEIDKKKGLGYIDFAETEGLRKAMAASPVKVGNSNVVVLENRSPYKKVHHVPPKPPSIASPAMSAASSPRPVLALPVSSAAEALVATSAPSETTNLTSGPETVSQDASESKDGSPATAEEAATTAPSPVQATNTTQTANPPLGPRGGRGGPKPHYRGGRGAFRGRGGQLHRGNPRNVSAPAQQNNVQDSAAPVAPAGGSLNQST